MKKIILIMINVAVTFQIFAQSSTIMEIQSVSRDTSEIKLILKQIQDSVFSLSSRVMLRSSSIQEENQLESVEVVVSFFPESDESFSYNVTSSSIQLTGYNAGNNGSQNITVSTESSNLDIECLSSGVLLFKEDFGGNILDCNKMSMLKTDPEYVNYSKTLSDYLFCESATAALGAGRYAIVKQSASNGGNWEQMTDHTYPDDPCKGYMMQVDGNTSDTKLFEKKIFDLCANTKLSFSAWVANVNKNSVSSNPTQQRATVTFNILDGKTKEILASSSTGDINTLGWLQYGNSFLLRESKDSVIFQIKNNNKSSSGNDYVIDDIEIRVCFPEVLLFGKQSVCEGEELEISSSFENDGVFESLHYSWFYSGEGDKTMNGWVVVENQHTDRLQLQSVSQSGYYRLAIAGSLENTISGNCRAISEPMYIEVKNCMPPCTDCPTSFAPIPGKKYVISAWMSYGAGTDDVYESDFKGKGSITVSFDEGTVITCDPSGSVIDGWQRISQEFTVPVRASKIEIKLNNDSGSEYLYFDDIRVHPFDASMKSYVYDPETLRLVAELDNENYATFYEYDEEGAMIRVKKETERGIMTIKEARQGMRKQ